MLQQPTAAPAADVLFRPVSDRDTDALAGGPLRWWPSLTPRIVRFLLVLVAIAIVLRIVALATVPLIPEEAYYWMYSQHPNLSYYDHPPMVAWMIGLGTHLFGDTEFGVRIVGCTMMLAASLLMYRFARAWFGRPAAILSALLLQVLPLYFGSGFVATMDSGLVFYWMLALVGVTLALRDGEAWGWYLAGAGLGGAMLAKYTGVFILVGTGLAVLAHAPWRRRWLLSPHPYLGVIVAAALFSPVVVWNARHDWASFRFQFVDRFENHSFHIRYVLVFIAWQLLVATPMVLLFAAAFIGRTTRTWRRLTRPSNIIALAFSLPLMAVMAWKSLKYDVHLNWTLPVFLSLFPAISRQFLVRMRHLRTTRLRLDWERQITWTAAICLVINIGLMLYLMVLQPRLKLISAFGPWDELARVVEVHEDALEVEGGHDPLIVGEGPYRLASILAFYRIPHEGDARAFPPRLTTSQWIVGGRGLGYAYWMERNDWQGRNCVYVFQGDSDDATRQMTSMKHHFASVQLVGELQLHRRAKDNYHIAVCKGLRL